MSAGQTAPAELDVAAAMTRSMLGWGVVAGPLYIAIGIALAVTRDGFKPTEHALSLLMLGHGGWMQRTNLVVAGVLVLVAAIGVGRALRYSHRRTSTALVTAIFAVALIASSVFAPDPANGFPPGSTESVTASGVMHLACGAVQFAAAVVAAAMLSRWALDTGWERAARASRLASIVTGAAFIAGASLTSTPLGVGLLWVAVITEFAWLAGVSICLWDIVPHPDISRRSTQDELTDA